MKTDVFNLDGKKVSTVELPDSIFAAKVNVDLMHQAYVRQMANARLGTHSTKSRGEVRGGGKKPWRQKGTGRARAGSTRSPVWVGGGKVHTPKPRDYTKRMPLKMRRAALRSALSAKAADDGIICVDGLTLSDPKTRTVAATLEKLAGTSSVLILIPEKSNDYDSLTRASRNLAHVKTLNARYLNVRDLLGFDKVLLPLPALEVISGYLGERGA